MQDDTTNPELTAHLWTRRWGILHRLAISVAYHRRRERFFDLMDKWCNAATALAATAAVTALVGKNEAANWLAAITAALSLVPLVFQPAGWARRHANLAMAFGYLQAKGASWGESWTSAQCDELATAIAQEEAQEPAPLTGLVADCENRQAVALGHLPPAPLTRWQRLAMHWVDLNTLKTKGTT